ncbi:hypothetical protein GURKE_00600 [Brevundimonas phage vB_BpoS-Gurke]|uniref:Uncharacterized protein n=1 Tax=Brevundimonas phage vB_BpoS-Gurke TaxID=2948599 RepID=A0A9E7N3Y6_9CAUD|nr:hypothetical protein GURKE_00600 [Brevundimonas phage vB_BpoS-Gurke]
MDSAVARRPAEALSLLPAYSSDLPKPVCRPRDRRGRETPPRRWLLLPHFHQGVNGRCDFCQKSSGRNRQKNRKPDADEQRQENDEGSEKSRQGAHTPTLIIRGDRVKANRKGLPLDQPGALRMSADASPPRPMARKTPVSAGCSVCPVVFAASRTQKPPARGAPGACTPTEGRHGRLLGPTPRGGCARFQSRRCSIGGYQQRR